MATTLCLSGAVLIKAGKGKNISLSGGSLKYAGQAAIDEFIYEAESYLCVLSGYNWIDHYSTLNADVKKILDEACSNLAAIYTIQYDMSGYTTRIEAEDMINILWARFRDCTKLLADTASLNYIKGA